MTLLPITITAAAGVTLINIWLATRIGALRHPKGISVGDGGDSALVARMRAQANLVEAAPFFIILLGLIELARGPHLMLWIAALLFLAARLAHPFGMDRPGSNLIRTISSTLSFLLLASLAGYGLWTVATAQPPSPAIMIA